jgi:hypothetical protein
MIRVNWLGYNLTHHVSFLSLRGRSGQSGSTSMNHLHHEVRIGTRCSLEWALENQDSECNTYGVDPHVNPFLTYPFSEVGCSVVEAELVQTPGKERDGIVRVTQPRRVLDVNEFSVQLVVPSWTGYEVIKSHVLNLNLRTGFEATSTDSLDTQDTSKPYLDPLLFGSYTGDTSVLEFVIPSSWIGSKSAESKFIVTVTNIWEDTPAELEFGLGDNWDQ